MISLSRRRLLAATGLAAGSLFLPSSRARAQTLAAPPKRLIVFLTQHGTVPTSWRMRPAGQPDDVSFDADLSMLSESDFSPILQPLHSLRHKLLVVDGVSMASAEADVISNNHDLGTRHALTGARMIDGAGGGPSIDQLVAARIKAANRIDSLELAVVAAANGGAVFRGAAQSIPADASPSSVFERVFPAGVDTPGELSNADRVRKSQASVLDVVQAEYERLEPKLRGADRQKLQLHRELVRSVEQRLTGLADVRCERPNDFQDDGGSGFGSADFYDRRASSMFEQTAAALACDLTRVVTIQMGQLTNEHIGAPPGDVHADFAHQQSNDELAHQMMTNYGRVHATQFAELLALLDAIPEDGGTLLDSCAVVWCNELGDGEHNLSPWPVVIGGGAMRAGRYVRIAPNTPNPTTATSFPGYAPVIGPPHNRLWVSVAQAVGADIDVVGDTQLTTPDGAVIDCTGPLTELS